MAATGAVTRIGEPHSELRGSWTNAQGAQESCSLTLAVPTHGDGLERIVMFLQGVRSVWEIDWDGTNTYGDILRSKKTVGWRTAMIVHELGREIRIRERRSPLARELRDIAGRLRDLARDAEGGWTVEQLGREVSAQLERLVKLHVLAEGGDADGRSEALAKLGEAVPDLILLDLALEILALFG